MKNATVDPRDRVIDEYFASCPDLQSVPGAAVTEGAPARYTAKDRERILANIYATSNERTIAVESARQQTLNLFTEDSCEADVPLATSRPSAFFSLVIKAYLSIHNGYSIDRLIADRDRNALFIKKCWSLGVQASPRELNWSLLNARKAKYIGSVQGVARYTMRADDMYQFLYASEIALRQIQDYEWMINQRHVSLDLILCDPSMSERFESTAKQLAPGFSSFEYRWAAMCIRKNQRRKVSSRPPRFQDIGQAAQIRRSSLPDQMGFYWFQSGDKPLYVGHAQNIRKQVDRIIEQGGSKQIFPEWMLQGSSEPVRIAVACTSVTALSKRETIKSELCLTQSPLFNVRAAGLDAPPDHTSSDQRRCA